MSPLEPPDTRVAPCEPLPAAISTLIDGAVAAFDADRESSRRYLLRASALLRAKRAAPADRQSDGEGRVRAGLTGWRLNRVIDYIESHLAEKITGHELAELIDVSVGQLFRAFKASVGAPPFHYIAQRRVELACRIMTTTDDSLSQVAIACGLCDQAHLCRVFRRTTGLSPAAWRRFNSIGPRARGSTRHFRRETGDGAAGRVETSPSGSADMERRRGG